MLKAYFEKLIQDKQKRQAELKERLTKTEDLAEARAIGETLAALSTEIEEARTQLAKIEEDEKNKEGRGLNPLASYGMAGAKGGEQRNDEDPTSKMEYRKAFMDFVQRGVMSDLLVKRADAEQVSTDLGILLPNTIINEIIKGVEKVYGQLYSRVKKTNLKGGVQYPIGSFTANMVWGGTAGTDTEHGVSEKQKAGQVNSYVQFTYHIGEIRIAQSLLQSVVTVDAFEKEIINALIEAYVKAMDTVILSGNGTNQPTGILTEAAKVSGSRIPSANIIPFTATELADWKQWQKKLFAKIPLSMRALSPQFVMTAETFESNIMTLEDLNKRPVYRETYNPVTGAETSTFKGREVVFVEEGGIKSFDGASENDIFAMYWIPEKAYALNTNLQFSYKKYFDEATNQTITKGIVIVDGQVLDGKYIYLLKKGA